MPNSTEDRSLLEVWAWKEQCYQEDEGLSFRVYRDKIAAIAAELKSKYHIQSDLRSSLPSRQTMALPGDSRQ